jgi:membrane-associated phospholipid phosphatase
MTIVSCALHGVVAKSRRMDRRFLLGAALVAALLMGAGFAGLDRALAEWVHSSGVEDARLFAWGLVALDAATGMGVWIWALGWVAIVIGTLELGWQRRVRFGHALIAAGLVQFAALQTMISGKELFGRLRPHQVLASGDWSHVWFAGGESFPSGHSAFYFGLLLPLAAACPIRWLRIVLVAIPVYVALARIDLAKHFVSDISASALMVSIYALVAASLIRHWLPAPARA